MKSQTLEYMLDFNCERSEGAEGVRPRGAQTQRSSFLHAYMEITDNASNTLKWCWSLRIKTNLLMFMS